MGRPYDFTLYRREGGQGGGGVGVYNHSLPPKYILHSSQARIDNLLQQSFGDMHVH